MLLPWGLMAAGSRRPASGRFIASDVDAKADRDAVPGVDRDHCQRQIHELFFRELRPGSGINLVGGARLRNESQALGPRKRSSLPPRIEWRFFPSIQGVETLLRFAFIAG